MRTLRRTTMVLALVALVVLATVGSALAAEPTAPDLATIKEKAIERIDTRLEGFQERLDGLEGREGPLAEQVTALLTEGIADLTDLRAEVEAATSAAEVRTLVRDAYGEFAAHARVRTAYAHVRLDLAQFTHRAELLEKAVARAAEAGFDTSRAAAQAEAARADLETAASLLDAVDPAATGPEVLAQIREAHRIAHSAQAHIRAGFWALVDATV